MIIGITGTLAAGKGTIVEILKEKEFKHYSVRSFLIEEIKKRGLIVNRDSMVLVANDLRGKYSPSYIAQELYSKARLGGKNCVIESLRTVGEIEALREKEDFYLFSVDANSFLRYERAKKRSSETDNVTYEKFLLNEKREMENIDPAKQNIKKCMELSNFHFENDGTINDLYKNIEITLKEMKESKVKENKNHISWDEYFMGVAILSGERSKDPSTQVGACLVDENNKIVGTGYNGAPRGFKDEDFPWEREGDFINTKYAYVCHAEINAILNSTKESLKECTFYTMLHPCNECAKAIIQAGIKKVVYLSDKYANLPAFIVARKLFEKCGVEVVEFKSEREKIEIGF